MLKIRKNDKIIKLEKNSRENFPNPGNPKNHGIKPKRVTNARALNAFLKFLPFKIESTTTGTRLGCKIKAPLQNQKQLEK